MPSSGFSPDDYLGGSRPPTSASYAPPLVGQQIGSQLAGLPAAYQQGRQWGLAEQLRGAFPDGLPMRPDGSVDALGIVNKVAGIQGMDASSIGPLLNLAARQSLSVGDQLPGAAAATPAAPPATPTARSTLGLSAPMASNDQSGDVNTVRGVATEVFGDTDVSHLLPRFAGALKVADADAPLSQDQIATARRIMGKSAAYLRSQPSQTDENGAAGTPVSSGVSGSPGPSASAGPSSAPLMSGARPPQGPQAGQPGTQPAAPAAGGGQRMAQAATAPNGSVGQPGRDPAAGLVPAGLNMSSLQYANWLQRRALAHSQAGDAEGAKLFQQASQPILDALKQAGEIPNEVKVAQSQGMTPLQYEAAKTQQGKDIDVYTKLNTGVQAMANTGVGMLPTLQAARSLIDAGAATGWGADRALSARQFLVRVAEQFPDVAKKVGFSLDSAQTLEGFGKQMAMFINEQTSNLKAEAIEMGGTSGRIFAQQVENMQKASPSPEYSPSGNKYLISVYERGINRSIQIADMANRYKNQYGRLDGNFETQMRNWQIQNPMFSPAEVRDPRLVSAPTHANLSQARAAGVKKGEIVKTPDGNYGVMP
jgi:hypothetical protein